MVKINYRLSFYDDFSITLSSVGLPLPLTENPDSPRIFLIRPGSFDPNLYTIQEVMKVSSMVNDILMNDDDNFIIAGQVNKNQHSKASDSYEMYL